MPMQLASFNAQLAKVHTAAGGLIERAATKEQAIAQKALVTSLIAELSLLNAKILAL